MTTRSKIQNIPVIRTPSEMQDWAYENRAEGLVLGCVPTMGALHEGHLSLIRRCAKECDETIVTIFVNPLQFGQKEDLDKYPRDEEADLKLAKGAGATVAYCPSVDDMYFDDRSVYVIEENLSKILCGKTRPTHFRGVITVVVKLFNACIPEKLYFGQKDYQQLLVIKRMVRDLDFPVMIVDCPIVREEDGLAMSSRNKYLSDADRILATSLHIALRLAEVEFATGEHNARKIENIVRNFIKEVEGARIEYIECRDAENLAEIEKIDRPAVLALAVFIGDTRLIDNIVLTTGKEIR